MNMIDKLLAADSKALTERTTTKYEVKRLSKILGSKFELTLQDIPAARYSEIQSDAVDMRGGKIGDVDLYKMQVETIVAGTLEPSLKDKKLLEHFSCATSHDLVAKLFNPAEMTAISGKISELCGFTPQEQVDKEVKN